MRLLVVGGTAFLGWHVVREAVRRGHEVTTFNRGRSGPDLPGVRAVRGDRAVAAQFGQLRGQRFDAVVDTSGYVPRVVRDNVAALGEVGCYAYVSSVSVYPGWPGGPVDEGSPVHDCGPDAGDVDYGPGKAGCERAVTAAYGERALLVRAGLLVGPRDNVGRLPWWLERIARGGDVLAPGDPDRPLQVIDARDLAAWLLDRAEPDAAQPPGGTFNATGPPGATTMGALLQSCVAATGSSARLRWVPDRALLDAGVEPWTELPLWMPDAPAYAGTWAVAAGRAAAAGLRARAVEESVRDTWQAMCSGPQPPPPASGAPRSGMDPDKERRVLAGAGP